jgi:hypothetical protein
MRASPHLRALAVRVLLEESLTWSERFRVEFDRGRLAQVLGEEMNALFPTLTGNGGLRPSTTHEEHLDRGRRSLLLTVLSFERAKWSDPPLNYIYQLLLFDGSGRIVLRANDNLEFILFSLPPEARERVLERYAAAGISADVIEHLDVDIEQGVGPS